MKKFIKDKRGQWAHPGKNTLIPNANGRITMKGVGYPLLGIDDEGNSAVMQPGGEYQFPGNSVYEIPLTEDEAMAYAANGYIVEELPKAQDAGQVNGIKSLMEFQQGFKTPEITKSDRKLVYGEPGFKEQQTTYIAQGKTPSTIEQIKQSDTVDQIKQRMLKSVTPYGYDAGFALREFLQGENAPMPYEDMSGNKTISWDNFENARMFGLNPERGRYVKKAADEGFLCYLYPEKCGTEIFTKSNFKPTSSKNPDSEYKSFANDDDVWDDVINYNIIDGLKTNGNFQLESLAGGSTLGHYTLSKGYDKKRKLPYISYYDKYDLDKIPGMDSVIGNPFEIYGRMYYDPKTKERLFPDQKKLPKKKDGGESDDVAIYSTILDGIGAPVTDENLKFLKAWRQAEGGTAANNPFNTTYKLDIDEDKTDYNSVGVKNYSTPEHGIAATIKTLQLPYYKNIVSGLQNDVGASNIASNTDELKTWGTGAGVARVLGGGKINPPSIKGDDGKSIYNADPIPSDQVAVVPEVAEPAEEKRSFRDLLDLVEEDDVAVEEKEEVTPTPIGIQAIEDPFPIYSQAMAAMGTPLYTDVQQRMLASQQYMKEGGFILDLDENDVAKYVADGYVLEELPKAQNGISGLMEFQKTLKKPTTTTAVKKEPVANSQAAQFVKNNTKEHVKKVAKAHKDAGTKPLEITPEIANEITEKDVVDFAKELTINPIKRTYDRVTTDPIGLAKNISTAFMDLSPASLMIKGGKELYDYNFGDGNFEFDNVVDTGAVGETFDAFSVIPAAKGAKTAFKFAKPFLKYADNVLMNAPRAQMTLNSGVNPNMIVNAYQDARNAVQGIGNRFSKSTATVTDDLIRDYNYAIDMQNQGLIKGVPDNPQQFEAWLSSKYNNKPIYRVVDVDPNLPLEQQYAQAETYGTSLAPKNVINRGRRSGGHDELLEGTNSDILYTSPDPSWIGPRYGGKNPFYVKMFADQAPKGRVEQVNQLLKGSKSNTNYVRQYPGFHPDKVPSGALFEDKVLSFDANQITPIIGRKGDKLRDAVNVVSGSDFERLLNKKFNHGGVHNKGGFILNLDENEALEYAKNGYIVEMQPGGSWNSGTPFPASNTVPKLDMVGDAIKQSPEPVKQEPVNTTRSFTEDFFNRSLRDKISNPDKFNPVIKQDFDFSVVDAVDSESTDTAPEYTRPIGSMPERLLTSEENLELAKNAFLENSTYEKIDNVTNYMDNLTKYEAEQKNKAKNDLIDSYKNASRDEVKVLQRQLQEKGFNIGASGADGIFGKNTKKALEQKLANESLDLSAVDKYYNKYKSDKSPQTTQQVVDIQNKLVEEGFLKSSQVDGKFGPITKAAFEKSNKSKDPNAMFFTNIPTKLEELQCAKGMCQILEQNDILTEALGVKYRNAWDIKENMDKKKNSTEVYNIYDNPAFDNVKSGSQLVKTTRQVKAKSSTTADMYKTGDIVGIFWPNSSHHGDVLNSKTHNTHVGFVSGVKNGVPQITHNVHGDVRTEPYSNLFTGWIQRPNKNVNLQSVKYDFKDQEFEDIDNIVNNAEIKKERSFTTSEKSNIKNTIKRVHSDAINLTEALGSSVDPDWLESATVGILGVETGIGLSVPRSRDDKGVITQAGYKVKDVKDEDISLGLSKTKFSQLDDFSKSYFDIKSWKDLGNDKKAAALTTYNLIKHYDTFKDYAEQFPELNLTEDDIRSMSILAHNRGTRKLLTLGRRGAKGTRNYYKGSEEDMFFQEVKKLRDMSRVGAYQSDISSTDWKYVPGAEYLPSGLTGKNSETYISKVKRYIADLYGDERLGEQNEQEAAQQSIYDTPYYRRQLSNKKEGGEFFELQLNEDEVAMYLNGGYVVEEIK